MAQGRKKGVRGSILIPKDLHRQFRAYCIKHGFQIGARVAILMRKELELKREAA